VDPHSAGPEPHGGPRDPAVEESGDTHSYLGIEYHSAA